MFLRNKKSACGIATWVKKRVVVKQKLTNFVLKKKACGIATVALKTVFYNKNIL